MKYNKSEIDFYTDTLIVNALLSNDTGLSKKAQAGGVISQLIDKVSHYVSNNIDSKDKAGSLLNLLAPGAISMAFGAMGLGWLGVLLGLSMRIFHIDVKSILSSIWDKLKGILSNDKPVSSSQIDEIVSSSVSQYNTPATEDEASQAIQNMKTQSTTLNDAKILKLAMIEFEKPNYGLISQAGFLDLFSARKNKTASLLSKVLGWIFKVAIASAGLMVAGDVVNKFIGRPNAIDDTVQNGKPVTQTSQQIFTAPASTQTKFKVQPGYNNDLRNVNNNWVENVSNDEASIGAMLIKFAKQVYQGLDNLDNVISATAGFDVVKNKITFYNRTSAGDQMIFIPKYFTSKKQIVDTFIDDVAKNAP